MWEAAWAWRPPEGPTLAEVSARVTAWDKNISCNEKSSIMQLDNGFQYCCYSTCNLDFILNHLLWFWLAKIGWGDFILKFIHNHSWIYFVISLVCVIAMVRSMHLVAMFQLFIVGWFRFFNQFQFIFGNTASKCNLKVKVVYNQNFKGICISQNEEQLFKGLVPKVSEA